MSDAQLISPILALVLRIHGLTADDVTPEQLEIWEDMLRQKMKEAEGRA